MKTKLAIAFKFLGESHFAGYVLALPEVPPVIGRGVTQTRQRLEQQIQTHFAINFPDQTFSIARTFLLFPIEDLGQISASPST